MRLPIWPCAYLVDQCRYLCVVHLRTGSISGAADTSAHITHNEILAHKAIPSPWTDKLYSNFSQFSVSAIFHGSKLWNKKIYCRPIITGAFQWQETGCGMAAMTWLKIHCSQSKYKQSNKGKRKRRNEWKWEEQYFKDEAEWECRRRNCIVWKKNVRQTRSTFETDAIAPNAYFKNRSTHTECTNVRNEYPYLLSDHMHVASLERLCNFQALCLCCIFSGFTLALIMKRAYVCVLVGIQRIHRQCKNRRWNRISNRGMGCIAQYHRASAFLKRIDLIIMLNGKWQHFIGQHNARRFLHKSWKQYGPNYIRTKCV